MFHIASELILTVYLSYRSNYQTYAGLIMIIYPNIMRVTFQNNLTMPSRWGRKTEEIVRLLFKIQT